MKRPYIEQIIMSIAFGVPQSYRISFIIEDDKIKTYILPMLITNTF